MSCENLIARVFYDRDHAQLEHWRTASYAQHQALGEFYSDSVSILDRFVEAYRGLNNEIGDVPKHKPSSETPTILKCLGENAQWIATNRSKISEGVEALQNILDELVGLYLTTIYKLKNLK